MNTTLIDIISYVIAFSVLIYIKPYASRLSISFISDYKLKTRIKRIMNKTIGDSFDDDDEDESIGLNKKGPTFGSNAIFNYIAEKNQKLIEDMQVLLLKAGRRNENALEEFMRSKFLYGIVIFIIILLTLLTSKTGLPTWSCFPISLIVGFLGGNRLTDMSLESIANKRMESIERGVPDLVDLLVICTESGLDLNRSIRRIARELRTSNSVLADELSLTSIEMEMIPDHRQVFKNLEERTNSLQIKVISKTLSQSIEYGSSLAVSLRDLAVESRQRRMILAETRAAQAPTLLTLPMMFFIMPCLFIVMLGPVIISMIKSFE